MPAGGHRPFKVAIERECGNCGAKFPALYANHRYCSGKCKRQRKRRATWVIPIPTERARLAETGSITEMMVCADLLLRGWQVFRAISPASPYDLLISFEGEHKSVEVKKGLVSRSGKKVQFVQKSGKKRKSLRDGTDFVAIVIMETREIFYFPVVSQTSIFFVDKAIDMFPTRRRMPNHPRESELIAGISPADDSVQK